MVALTEDIEMREDEEGYNEQDDEDFNPNAAAAANEDISSSSGSDEEDVDAAAAAAAAATAPSKSPKKAAKRKAQSAEDADLDSGDEATIKERKRKKRKATKDGDGDGEDSGGEGGLIKTRAQRAAEKVERKELKRTQRGEVTIDVDAVWMEMMSVPIGEAVVASKPAVDGGDVEMGGDKENEGDYVVVKRRIEYAGETTEVEERVLRTSKEGQRWLREQEAVDALAKPRDQAIRRPLRRYSRFEPNPTGAVKGLPPDKQRLRAPSRQDVIMAEHRAEEERKKKAEKMTTVQKSALDWKGFVSEQGLGEELDTYGKSKGGYLEREGFLGRAAGRRDEEARNARMKG